MDDELVLKRLHVPGEIQVTSRLAAPNQAVPFIERQQRIAACGPMLNMQVVDRAEECFHQRQTMDADIQERVAAVVVMFGYRAARIWRIIRSSEEIHRQHIAAGALPGQVESFENNRIEPSGMA